MDTTKRVPPTELEARVLLRDVARRMEDERVIEDYCERVRRFRGSVRGHLLPTLLAVGAFLLLQGRGVPIELAGAIGVLAATALSNAIAIGDLTRVTAALARTAARMRAAPPLPRAPSPPGEG